MEEDKKRSVPTFRNFDGWETSQYIMEKIMYRKFWCTEDRNILSEKLESLVQSEIARYEKHRVKAEKIRATNDRIIEAAKKAAAVKKAARGRKSRQEKKNGN